MHFLSLRSGKGQAVIVGSFTVPPISMNLSNTNFPDLAGSALSGAVIRAGARSLIRCY